MTHKLILIPLVIGGFMLGGCDNDGAVEKAGEKIDKAAEKTGEAIEKAADNVEDKVDNEKK